MADLEKVPEVRVSEHSSSTRDISNDKPHPNRTSASNPDDSFGWDDWWIWEIIGVVVSAAAICAIIGLLVRVDGKKLENWGITIPDKTIRGKFVPGRTVVISLNSVISWISTVGKICILIPITKGIGQLKWVWFAEQERQLSDFEKFENATRGLTGSVMLLWKLRGRHFAAIGAIAIILGLGFDPFIQNLVSYETIYDITPASTSYVSKADVWTGTNMDNQKYMKGMINTGLYSLNDNWRTPMYDCGTGNCTWSGYSTLAICNKCKDLTPSLVMTCQNSTAANSTLGAACDYSLPNGMHLGSDGHTVMAVNMSREALFYSNYSNPLAIIQSIRASDDSVFFSDSNANAIASECALTPCIATLNSSIGLWEQTQRFKVSPEDMHNSHSVDNYAEYEWLTYDKYGYDTSSGISITPPANKAFGINGSTYSIPADEYQSMQAYLQQLFQGFVVANGQNNFTYEAELHSGPSDALQILHDTVGTTCESYYEFSDFPGTTTVECTMRNIAQAMTIAMRDSQFLTIPSPNYAPSLASIASGTQTGPFTRVTVTWYWIILPIIIWLLSVTMLLGTAWKTRKAGVRTWRTNPLALVFLELGQDEMTQGKKENPLTEKGLAKRADELKVQLRLTRDEAVLENKSKTW